MSKPVKEFSQQILFEQIPLENSDDNNSVTQQVIVENENWQALPELSDDAFLEIDAKPVVQKKGSWFGKTMLAVFSILIGIELTDFFIQGFETYPITTSLYALVTLGVGFLAGTALFKELKGLRQFKQCQTHHTKIESAFAGNEIKALAPMLNGITKKLPQDLDSQQIKTWQQAQDKGLSQIELLDTYSRVVLTPVDEKAIKEVAKFSSEAVALVAISPVAVLDMLLLLWRNLRMIDKVSSLYGLQLGYWSRIKLLKQVFINMAYAGASELLVDLGTEAIGADLLGKLSGRFAQGFGAGMLTARLGLRVMHLSRPVPFHQQKPSLTQVRKQVVQQILSLISKGKNERLAVSKKNEP